MNYFNEVHHLQSAVADLHFSDTGFVCLHAESPLDKFSTIVHLCWSSELICIQTFLIIQGSVNTENCVVL